MKQKQIIAMGGGGFSMEPDNPLLDKYIISCAEKENPILCFLPTASGDAESYITKFYTAFTRMNCQPRHLSLFRQPADLEKEIMECDIIYVGGGNTRNMLAIWKASGLDLLLHQAWEQGIILCGLSAGAICWFEQGHTDSAGGLGPMDCLAYLPGSCSPHYDGEPDRRPSYHELLLNGSLKNGLALDDGSAAHFIDKDLKEVVTSRENAKAHNVSVKDGKVIEEEIPTKYLGCSISR